MMLILWLISLRIGDVSFIDAFWPVGFMVAALISFVLTPYSVHGLVMVVLTLIWGTRLSLYLFWRWLGHGVDKRYAAMLKSKTPEQQRLWTLKYVFGLQGLLIVIVALPLQFGQLGIQPPQLGLIASVGVALSLIGIAFETIGDWQLARFKANPDNAGLVMDRGLWRYTRHPNYFGDACFWWGIYLIASETGLGLLALPGPILMTFLLVHWSGARLLEKGLRHSKPGYEDYIARTSAFIPMPPKSAATPARS